MRILNDTLYHLPETFDSINGFSFDLQNPLKDPIQINGHINDLEIIKDIRSHLNSNTIDEIDEICEPYCMQVGIDEVGRGPLYGSVVVSAAVLPSRWSGEIDAKLLNNTPLQIMTDSKKLTEKKRELLFEPINELALLILTVDIPACVIDEINILQATLLGMRLASERAICSMAVFLENNVQKFIGMHHDEVKESILDKTENNDTSHYPHTDLSRHHNLSKQDNTFKQIDLSEMVTFELLIDGNTVPNLNNRIFKKDRIQIRSKFDDDNDLNDNLDNFISNNGNLDEGNTDIGNSMTESCYSFKAQALVKGDGRHTAIAAASIIAKVTRDRHLIQEGFIYPGYGLENHKGYPTKPHIEAIAELGVLPKHRRSFKPVRDALSTSK